MIAKDLITDEVPPLKTTDSGSKALRWMDEFKVSHLPVVNGKTFVGIISDADIFDLNTPEEEICKLRIPLVRPFVTEGQHAFDVLKIMSELNLTTMAIVDEEYNFIGTITYKSFIEKLAALSAIKDPGGIIILEMATNNYSLSQIAQIVEGNDAKILACYLTSSLDSTQVEVTLKINKDDLSAILQTFFRYNYTVKASFHQSAFSEDMKERFDQLMHYINI
jgi:acetoin utilization protein AcuB